MILWVDGGHDPGENMRRDRLLLDAAARRGRDAEPVLRVFNFTPHGITLGHSQVPERELDLRRCEADDVPWAVRPTGGRAIFHAEEWTYSLVAPISHPEWGGSLSQAYERASELILAALQRLGVAAALARRRVASSENGSAVSPACFAALARHEILLDGKKLVGSAQRRIAGALLQQGSVLVGSGHLRLVDYLALDELRREESRLALRDGSTDAASYLGGDIRLVRFADALSDVLRSGARRVEGSSGLFLLTLSESAPYTRSAVSTG